MKAIKRKLPKNVISKNYNGAVLKTANPGYSVKATVKRLEKILSERGILIDTKEIASTGTTYIRVIHSEELFTFRVANHTKRNQTLFDAEYYNDASIYNWYNEDGGVNDEFQILNKDTFDYIVSKLFL